jgi:hypothetical protein
MTRPSGRKADCGIDQARTRLRQAQSFAHVATTVHEDPENTEMPLGGVSTALAVLAAIAASDAMCCARLGKVSRGQDHTLAIEMVRMVVPEGAEVAEDLRRLLDLKDQSHYEWVFVSPEDARAAIRRMKRIVEAAGKVVR